MLKGLLLIISIVVFGILTILTVIFSIISFANSKKSKFIWLGGFAFSMIALISSVFFLVSGIAQKANSFGNNLENALNAANKNVLNQIDTSEFKTYAIADSVNSEQIEYLISIESQTHKGEVPKQFYHYLGFKDYYRLPLKYPFSLHCIDSLDNASLFNEIKVARFDENDNGEKDCAVNNISEFVFDENMLIAKRKFQEDNKEKTTYIIYHFEQGRLEEIESINKFDLRVKNLKFQKILTFISCKEYFKSF
jgi:hypothetical protein